jgi:hypothetical protein
MMRIPECCAVLALCTYHIIDVLVRILIILLLSSNAIQLCRI